MGIVPFAIHYIFCMLTTSTGSQPSGLRDNRVLSQPNLMTTTHALSRECLKLLTLREVAESLRVAPITVQRLVARRVLPVYRVARRLFFRETDISSWLEAQRTDPIERP